MINGFVRGQKRSDLKRPRPTPESNPRTGIDQNRVHVQTEKGSSILKSVCVVISVLIEANFVSINLTPPM
jgi:hypothetical protein